MQARLHAAERQASDDSLTAAGRAAPAGDPWPCGAGIMALTAFPRRREGSCLKGWRHHRTVAACDELVTELKRAFRTVADFGGGHVIREVGAQRLIPAPPELATNSLSGNAGQLRLFMRGAAGAGSACQSRAYRFLSARRGDDATQAHCVTSNVEQASRRGLPAGGHSAGSVSSPGAGPRTRYARRTADIRCRTGRLALSSRLAGCEGWLDGSVRRGRPRCCPCSTAEPG